MQRLQTSEECLCRRCRREQQTAPNDRERVGGLGEEGAAYAHLGSAYDSLGDYDKAIEYTSITARPLLLPLGPVGCEGHQTSTGFDNT